MIPVGEPYKPTDQFRLVETIQATILGVLVATLAAGLVWLWEISPIPTLVIVTPLLQGFVVGLALAVLFRRVKLRSPGMAAAIGLLCGLLSIGLVHFGHYVMMVRAVSSGMREQVEGDQDLTPEARDQLLAQLKSQPARMVDRFVLIPETGHSGFVGSMILRSRQGVMIKHMELTGTGVWVLWACEALAVMMVAAAMAAAAASEPFCEECDTWCEKAPNVAMLPGAHADPLAEAVRADDAKGVVALKSNPPAAEEARPGATSATLHSCPGCGLSFADVTLRVVKGDKTQEVAKVKRLRVSPEMVEALRGTPAQPAPQAAGDAAAEPVEPVG